MTTKPSSRFAVIGATGQQGGAVAEALLDAGVGFRAIVRDAGSPEAVALSNRGVTIEVGDQDDPSSIRRALKDIDALYFMTTSNGPDGFERETKRGIDVADAAVAAGVSRVVYSSVGGAERHTRIPHFESKRRVEEHLSKVIPSRFVRPTFFMENLRMQIVNTSEDAIVLRLPLSASTPLQMIAVRDIGRVAASLLVAPEGIERDGVEIAGDELNLSEAAAAVSRVLGRPARFDPVPLPPTVDEDRSTMFRWFEDTPSYQADFELTRRLAPNPLSFAEWLTQL